MSEPTKREAGKCVLLEVARGHFWCRTCLKYHPPEAPSPATGACGNGCTKSWGHTGDCASPAQQGATARPWHVNAIQRDRIIGDETATGWDKLHINGPNATVAKVFHPADARLIVDAVNEREGLKAERDGLRRLVDDKHESIRVQANLIRERNTEIVTLRSRLASVEGALEKVSVRVMTDGSLCWCDDVNFMPLTKRHESGCAEARAALKGGAK